MSRVERLLRLGQLQPSQMRWFVGESGWWAGQLEDEVSRGVWQLASASALQLQPMQ